MYGTDVISENQILQELHRLGDVGTERAVLACIMHCPALILEAEQHLPPEAFSFELNRYVYDVMRGVAGHCRKRNIEPCFDPVSLLAVAQERGPKIAEAFRQKTDGLAQVRSIHA